jgi:hypothetical protein
MKRNAMSLRFLEKKVSLNYEVLIAGLKVHLAGAMVEYLQATDGHLISPNVQA